LEGTCASLPGLRQGSARKPTAIIENKRLGHALAIIKTQQDLKYVPKVKTNSEKIGYQKRERKSEASANATEPSVCLYNERSRDGTISGCDLGCDSMPILASYRRSK
jgi:hypothetical protein